MKKHILLYMLPLLILSGLVEGKEKPDYFTYNQDGSVKTRGVYQVNENGTVTEFTLYDGEGKKKYTEIPYYSKDGTLLRANQLDPSGKILKVIIPLEKELIVLIPEGYVLEKQPYTSSKG